jgi:hypothetical protein
MPTEELGLMEQVADAAPAVSISAVPEKPFAVALFSADNADRVAVTE